MIEDRIESICGKLGVEVQYAFQTLDDLPKGVTLPEGRKKPWGTGQAVLDGKGLIQEPFAVINADDYYGKDAFVAKAETGASADGIDLDVESPVSMNMWGLTPEFVDLLEEGFAPFFTVSPATNCRRSIFYPLISASFWSRTGYPSRCWRPLTSGSASRTRRTKWPRYFKNCTSRASMTTPSTETLPRCKRNQ